MMNNISANTTNNMTSNTTSNATNNTTNNTTSNTAGVTNQSCTLCPRACQVNRSAGATGVCGCTDELYVSRAALHMWEEPCISGEEGSGTVFFSGCPLRCVFCQNGAISGASAGAPDTRAGAPEASNITDEHWEDGSIAPGGLAGKKITVQRLAQIFIEQQERGANNINLVTPTHYILQIVEAIKLARTMGLTLPIVYNTSGYETVESLKMLEELVDVYLPDFKYLDSNLAKRYSKAEDYPEVAKAALAEMFRQVGKPAFDHRDMMTRGIIVRHLVLPEHTEDSKAVIKYLYDTYGDKIYLSIMSQYTPMPELMPGGRLHEKFPELGRKITTQEYDEVVDYAIDLGVENAFIQEGDVAEESFIPPFDCEGV